AEDFGLDPSATAEDLMRSALDAADDAHADQRAAVLPLPAPVVDARRTALVGRVAELRVVEALLGEDGTRFAMILGPAGIGKSRLASEVAARAHDAGSLVCFGACTEGPASPYRPMVDAFTAARLTAGADD